MNIVKNNNDRLSFQCKYHQDYDPQYLLLNSEEEDILLCNNCLDEPQYFRLNLGDFQQIQNLLKSNDDTILHKWPPLQNQSVLSEIKLYFKEHASEVNNNQEIIEQHFDNIKAIIIDHIEGLKKQTLVKYNKLPELEAEFYDLYNQIAEKDQIKNILLQQDANFDKVQSTFKVILKEKEELKQKNEEAILQIFNLYKKYTAQLNEKKLNELTQKIISIAKNATYFPPIEDVINYSIGNISDLQDVQLDFTSTSLSPEVRTLLDLIKNPLNLLSEEYEASITKQIIQLTPYLHFDINQMNRENDQPIKRRKLGDEQMKMLLLLQNKMIEIEDYFKPSNVTEKVFPFTKFRIEQFTKTKNYSQIKNILQYLPIFELVDSKIAFEISYSFGQQYLQSTILNNNTVQFCKKDNNGWQNTIISHLFLNRNISYKLQFQTKRFQNNIEGNFCVGLLDNKEQILYSQYLCLELHSQNKYGIEIFKKGSFNNFKNCSQFELTVNVSKGQLEISDYPEFNNTVELNSERKQYLQESFNQFYIGFSIYYANDQILINNIEQINPL